MAEAKKITFTYEGKGYTLEFDRKTVKLLERRGFNVNDLDAKPLTLLPQLFWGAFQKHHKGITQETTDAILMSVANRDTLFGKLSEMYIEPINALLGEDEAEDAEGNVNWDPNW